MPVLTALDVIGIQRYVFASNRLRDVVGASELVRWATSRELLAEVAGAGEVLQAAGGNAVLRFDDLEPARSFTGRYTRRLLEQAPGLDVAVAHRPYRDGELAACLRAVQVDLARAKGEATPAAPPFGLAVTARCAATGWPAVTVEAGGGRQALSASAAAARATAAQARGQRHLDAADAHLDGKRPTFPLELDDLGRTTGERSLLGVVHVDGNAVGQRIAEWLTGHIDEGAPDTTVVGELRSWSQALDDAAEAVMATVVTRVAGAVRTSEGNHRCAGRRPDLDFALKIRHGELCLPLRPILVGGDDLTFVCDGRIALDLAATAARAFATRDIPELGGRLSACAGVVIVGSHSPFRRAYELAGALCASAKAACRQHRWSSALDWHLGTVRPGTALEDLRRRQYGAGRLTARPYRLDGGGPQGWDWLIEELLDGQNGLRAGAWACARGKAKALAAAARDGEQAVGRALDAWRLHIPGLALPPAVASGFRDGRSPLLDALELLDRAQILDGSS